MFATAPKALMVAVDFVGCGFGTWCRCPMNVPSLAAGTSRARGLFLFLFLCMGKNVSRHMCEVWKEEAACVYVLPPPNPTHMCKDTTPWDACVR